MANLSEVLHKIQAVATVGYLIEEINYPQNKNGDTILTITYDMSKGQDPVEVIGQDEQPDPVEHQQSEAVG